MDDTADDFHHGEMPIAAQAHTYAMFGTLAKWFSLHIAVLLVTFVLWFCTGAGFFASVIAGAIVWAVGVFALRNKMLSEH
jgi:hypothetical protein